MKTILVGFILGVFYLFSDRILEIRKNVTQVSDLDFEVEFIA